MASPLLDESVVVGRVTTVVCQILEMIMSLATSDCLCLMSPPTTTPCGILPLRNDYFAMSYHTYVGIPQDDETRRRES